MFVLVARSILNLFKLVQNCHLQIAGKIKTKFRYIKTAACDYGMAIEEILNLTDKDLNQRVSLKKLRPYRLDASDNTPWFRRRYKAFR